MLRIPAGRTGKETNEFGRYIIRAAVSVASYLEIEKDGNVKNGNGKKKNNDSDSPGNEDARRIS